MRGARIARAAAADGFDVTVVVGGVLPAGLDFGPCAVRPLPPVKAGPGGFGDLVTAEGLPFDAARRADRRDRLLALFAGVDPDVLLIEAFPFGRRAMRFELLPLVEAARGRADPPLVVSSVRDILQASRKPGRDAEVVDIARRAFDRVIVHGDPALCPLERSFPPATRIADRLAYSGLVGPDPDSGPADAEAFDVIVSVGGGAVGAGLIEAALAARPLSRAAGLSWLVLTGPNLPEAARPVPRPGLTLRAFAADLPARLRRARLSISQAGYNTVADLMAAPACRAVLVPYAGNGETEQAVRAAILAERGWAEVVASESLSPATLAFAIDRALDLPERPRLPLDGAARTALLLREALAARAPDGPGLRRPAPCATDDRDHP